MCPLSRRLVWVPACQVLDSPFSKLTALMMDIVKDFKLPLPKMLAKVAIGQMRRSIKKRAKFDLYEVAPVKQVVKAYTPALFGHGREVGACPCPWLPVHSSSTASIIARCAATLHMRGGRARPCLEDRSPLAWQLQGTVRSTRCPLLPRRTSW